VEEELSGKEKQEEKKKKQRKDPMIFQDTDTRGSVTVENKRRSGRMLEKKKTKNQK